MFVVTTVNITILWTILFLKLKLDVKKKTL